MAIVAHRSNGLLAETEILSSFGVLEFNRCAFGLVDEPALLYVSRVQQLTVSAL